MFMQLLITSIFFILVVQSAVTNSSKGQPPTATPILSKQASLYDDYDLTDKKTNAEGGSGAAASLDEYADEEEDDQLSKITATTMSSSTSTTTTTTKRTTTKIPEQKDGNSTKNDDLGVDEFNEDYKDDLEDDIDYNEITTKMTSVSLSSTRPSSVVQRHTPIRILFSFLTRPPIAAGILAG